MAKSIPDKPVPHGTHSGYSRYRCRCDECKAAGSAYHRAYYERNRERKLAAGARRYAANSEVLAAAQRERYAANAERERTAARARYAANPDKYKDAAAARRVRGVPIPHGTLYGYAEDFCRCAECKAAKATSARIYREQNSETVAARKAAYHAANRDAVLQSQREWRTANLDAVRERDRQRGVVRGADPAYREWRAQYYKRYYQQNRDQVLARTAAYALANPEIRRRAVQRWREQHPERQRMACARWAATHREAVVEQSARRRARKRANDTRTVTARDWRRLCARYGNCCAYCGEPEKLTQDHIIPIVRGGRHAIGNLLPACRSCNSRKRHRLLVEWRLTLLIAEAV